MSAMTAPPPSPVPLSWISTAAPQAELRRSLLRAARPGSVMQDRIDCAELAFAAGLPDVARMLYGLVLLEVGFSPEGLRFQRELDARTGLWKLPGPAGELSREPAPPRFSVEIALAELKRLMRLEIDFGRWPDVESLAPPDLAVPEPDLATLGDAVRALLTEVPQLAARGQLGLALCGLADVLTTVGPIALEEHLNEDPGGLATLFAVQNLRAAALTARDLLEADPSGALFHEAGRLAPAGLGPYFSNLHFIVRNGRDVLALIEAASEGRGAEEERDGWCVLLSHGLNAHEAGDLAVELGDRGRLGALRKILVRTARWSGVERRFEVLWRVRDAGIDLGDFALAVGAQQLIAAWSPTSTVEWSILGDISATMGDVETATTAFERCLRLNRSDEGVNERLMALRSDAFGPFEVSRGYGSSPVRQQLRSARAAVARPSPTMSPEKPAPI